MSQRPGRKISRHQQARSRSAAAEQEAKSRRLKVIVGAVSMAFLLVVFMVVFLVGDDGSSSTDVEQVGFAETIGTSLPSYEGDPDDPAIGMPAPQISAQGFDDEPITVEPGDGRSKIIGFFVHSCPHCQRELPRVVASLERDPVPDDVDVIAVSTVVDENQNNYPPSEWFEREGWEETLIRDDAESRVATGYGMTGYPYFVVVDGDGTVVTRTSGELTDPQWDALVDAAA